ncbi:MAG: DnaJ domain-containing protein [Gammaproteobacteria bacterium]
MSMRALLILGPLVLLGLLLLGHWFVRSPTLVVARFLRRGALVLALLALLLLAASGHLHWLVALAGALLAALIRLLPLLRYAPLLHQLWRRMRPATPFSTAADQSTLQTRFVRMALDHASGQMHGEILEGAFAGRRLHELSRVQLIDLFKECQLADRDSANLLAAYLDRAFGPDWRNGRDARSPGSSDPGRMTRQEAYRVLGLEPGASDSDIIAAHRRLMQKMHPDRGGSDYLAAKINQAKDNLLDH